MTRTDPPVVTAGPDKITAAIDHDRTDRGRPFDAEDDSVVPAATPADLGHDDASDHGEHDGGDRHDQADDDHGGEAVLEDAAGGVGVHGTTVPTATLGPGDFPASSIGSPAP